MIKKIEYIYENPVDGRVTTTVIEHFYIGNDIPQQIKTIFETRIAPLSTLISYKEI